MNITPSNNRFVAQTPNTGSTDNTNAQSRWTTNYTYRPSNINFIQLLNLLLKILRQISNTPRPTPIPVPVPSPATPTPVTPAPVTPTPSVTPTPTTPSPSAGLVFGAPGSRLATVEVVGTSADWGGSELADVKAVLDSVLDVYSQFAGGRNLGKILVSNNSGSNGELGLPIALFDKGPNGESRIRLALPEGLKWDRMAFQFAHEVGHLLSNLKPELNGTGNLWFEEALNESLNLFVLGEMSKRWETNPPYPNWADYAPKLKEYVDKARAEAERKLPADTTLPQWLNTKLDDLTTYPTGPNGSYDHVQLIGEQLLLPLMQRNPELLHAISYANLRDPNVKIPFTQYLQNWYDDAPASLRPVIDKVRQGLLGSTAST